MISRVAHLGLLVVLMVDVDMVVAVIDTAAVFIQVFAFVVVVLVEVVLMGLSSGVGYIGVIKYRRWFVALFRAGEVLFLKFNRSVSREREARRLSIEIYLFIYSFITLVILKSLATHTLLLLSFPCLVASSFVYLLITVSL